MIGCRHDLRAEARAVQLGEIDGCVPPLFELVGHDALVEQRPEPCDVPIAFGLARRSEMDRRRKQMLPFDDVLLGAFVTLLGGSRRP